MCWICLNGVKSLSSPCATSSLMLSALPGIYLSQFSLLFQASPVIRNCIVIVISRLLERPQKRSRRNQLIHRRLTKTKSIGSGQDLESQAGRQSDGYGGWCLELRRGGRYEEDDESG